MRLSPSRRFSSRLLLTTVVAAALAAAPRMASADPLLSGTAGTGANTFYFTLDFRDFSAPQSYAFAYKSNATTLTFEQILNGLASGVPTFTTRISQSAQFGASLNGLGFAGKEKYNIFGGANSGEPNGYFSQWNSLTGLDGSWNSDLVGISNQTIGVNQYVGASWLADYTAGSALPPRTPQIGAAAAPEPGTLALLAAASGPMGLALACRRKTKRSA